MPERTRNLPWDRESYISPSSSSRADPSQGLALGSGRGSSLQVVRVSRFPQYTNEKLDESRSRIAPLSIHERFEGQKTLAQRQSGAVSPENPWYTDHPANQSRSRTAPPSIHERKRARKPFVYWRSLNTRTTSPGTDRPLGPGTPAPCQFGRRKRSLRRLTLTFAAGGSIIARRATSAYVGI